MADKAELKTYALGVSTKTCYEIIMCGGKKLRDICSVQGFVGVHPKERIQIFLYLTPAARRKAYRILKEAGIHSHIIAAPAFVPLSDVPLPEVDRDD